MLRSLARGSSYLILASATLMVSLCSPPSFAADPVLLADIATGTQAGNYRMAGWMVVGDRIIFSMQHPASGSGLWVTDGTSAGTQFIREFSYVDGQTTAFGLSAVVDDLVYFRSTVGGVPELWVTDGTNEGTRKVHSPVDQLVTHQGQLYYSYSDGLWTFDGSDAVMVATIPQSYNTLLLVSSGDTLYYIASSGTNPISYALYSYREGETTLVADRIGTQASWGVLTGYVAADGLLYFGVCNATEGCEPWVTDGTIDGTFSLGDLVPGTVGSIPTEFGAQGTSVYFTADTPDRGREPWYSDGTPAGTRPLLDINPHFNDSSVPTGYTASGNLALFNAKDDRGNKFVWATDGTPEGTRTVAFNQTLQGKVVPSPNGETYLFTAIGATSSGLWETDGTSDGTRLLKQTNATTSIGGPEPFGDLVVFRAPSEGQLWLSDGTSDGTVALDIPTPGLIPAGGIRDDGTQVFDFAQGKFFFEAAPQLASQFWVSQGTPETTARIEALDTRGVLGDIFYIVGGDPFTFVSGQSQTLSTRDVWSTDGTETGTTFRQDFQTWYDRTGQEPVALGNSVLFPGRTADLGDELWKMDFLTGQVSLVRNLLAGSSGSEPRNLAVVGDTAYFGALLSSNNRELWKSDGTEAGTVLVEDLVQCFNYEPWLPTICSSNPSGFAALGDRTIFAAISREYGREPHVTDGTAGGTTLLKDVWEETYGAPSPTPTPLPSPTVWKAAEDSETDSTIKMPVLTTTIPTQPGDIPFDSDPNTFTPLGDGVVFLATSNAGSGPWYSDGTEEGTIHLASVLPYGYSFDIARFEPAQGKLYFLVRPANGAPTVWVTDGTTSGTIPVSFTANGQPLTSITALKAVDDQLLLSASTPATGNELWLCDGETGTATLLADINPGPAGSKPTVYGAMGGKLYIAAFHESYGREPWALDFP